MRVDLGTARDKRSNFEIRRSKIKPLTIIERGCFRCSDGRAYRGTPDQCRCGQWEDRASWRRVNRPEKDQRSKIRSMKRSILPACPILRDQFLLLRATIVVAILPLPLMMRNLSKRMTAILSLATNRNHDNKQNEILLTLLLFFLLAGGATGEGVVPGTPLPS